MSFKTGKATKFFISAYKLLHQSNSLLQIFKIVAWNLYVNRYTSQWQYWTTFICNFWCLTIQITNTFWRGGIQDLEWDYCPSISHLCIMHFNHNLTQKINIIFTLIILWRIISKKSLMCHYITFFKRIENIADWFWHFNLIISC